jgi:ubiquinone/menaquinone biosynthesis C-methylase UbiE
MMQRAIEALMRLFFKHLYTTYAWMYDFIAWSTSMGQWRTWQQAAHTKYTPGMLLELGHGPGHLLLDFFKIERDIVGVDASIQMTRLARRRIDDAGYNPAIVRARAQALPFKDDIFSGVISTFPSEYILDEGTLTSVSRVLQSKGKFVVIGLKKITGKSLHDRFASWLYRVTGQSGKTDQAYEPWLELLESSGFEARIEIDQQRRAEVLRLIAVRNH